MLAKSGAIKYGVTTAAPVEAVQVRTVSRGESEGNIWEICCVLLVLLMFMDYMVQFGLDEHRQKVQQVQAGVVQLTEENEILQLKVNQLKSLQRIQVIAETELGMVIPTAAVYSSAAANRR